MNEMSRINTIHQSDELEKDLMVYRLYRDLAAMPSKKIEGFREKAHVEIEANKDQIGDTGVMHNFIDVLIDTCIKTAKSREKNRQEDPYMEPTLAAASE